MSTPVDNPQCHPIDSAIPIVPLELRRNPYLHTYIPIKLLLLLLFAHLLSMASQTLFLFGDQTGDILTSLQELSKLGLDCHNLAVFLRRSTASLHRAIATAPSTVRRQVPSFSSPLELAAAVEEDGNNLPALRSALLAIVQLGNVIV